MSEQKAPRCMVCARLRTKVTVARGHVATAAKRAARGQLAVAALTERKGELTGALRDFEEHQKTHQEES